MAGDASAFLDPVFSSGVYLAMHSASHAAELVNAVLDGARERPLQRAYEREMRAGLREFSWFIVRFTTPALAWLFANPRNVLRVEEAMVSMLSGHVFDARATLRRLRVFKVLYYLTSSVHVARHVEASARSARAGSGRDEQHRIPRLSTGRAAHRVPAAGARPAAARGRVVRRAIRPTRPHPCRARCARVRLEPLAGAGLTEVWYANGPVHTGFDGQIRFAADDHHLAAAIEVDEREHGGLAGAAAYVYSRIAQFQLTLALPPSAAHLELPGRHQPGRRRPGALSAVLLGPYRGFQAAAASSDFRRPPPSGGGMARECCRFTGWPGREPGIALENPRQISAYKYPRQYGPTPPAFSRAMLVAPDLLMISGTASIVGHASQHAGNVERQMTEIFSNLDSLLMRARAHAPALPLRFGGITLIKAYLRDRENLALCRTAAARPAAAGLRPPSSALAGDYLLAAGLCSSRSTACTRRLKIEPLPDLVLAS